MTESDIASFDTDKLLEFQHMLAHDSSMFARVVMGHIVTTMPDHHKRMYRLYDATTGANRSLDNVAMVMFRKAAKSTTKTIKTLHDICHAHEPMVLFLSEAEDQSIRDLVSLQDEIESNEMLRTLYGDLKGHRTWSKTESEFANGVYVAAKGWRSKVRGIKWKAQRPTKMWLDDFEGEGNSKTDQARADVRQWIKAQVMPAGGQDPALIFLGTIVHPDAYLARSKNLSIFKPPRGAFMQIDISSSKDGKDIPAWPEFYPMDWIWREKKKYEEDGDLSLFYQEYYNIPAEESQPKFNMEAIESISGCSFEKYGPLTFLSDGQKKFPINTFIGVDPASTDNARSDRTVIFVLGQFPNGNIVVLDIYADKIDMVQQISKIFEYADRYMPKMMTIETYGYQQSLYDWVHAEQVKRKTFFPIRGFKERIGKSAKFLEGMVPLINNRRVAHLHDCPNIDLFMKEGKHFSGGVRDHDDTLDGMFLAQINAYPPPNYNVDTKIKEYQELNKDKARDKRKVATWAVL